ncbi:hypothetical protein PSACC_00526 [Paramicrosporidium saccamoebae]|uniref:Uncharacterized protein n=1 Tax=Paramicrosporidium saccamoebae TaxID=1246581 RepID=A0A2H9TPI6_9FUNG|nr:hypothetical protein PSACC_00526 [Paramicrosporidium saccamoebae]
MWLSIDLWVYHIKLYGAGVVFQYKGDTLPSIGEDGDFNFFSAGDFISNDGTARIQDERLLIDSSPFTSHSPTLLDNPKYQIFTNKHFSIDDSTLSVKMTAAVTTPGVQDHPFGPYVTNPYSDPRLAAGAMIVKDDEHGVIYDFVLTEQRICAVVQSLLFTPAGPNQSPSAAYAIPLLDTTEMTRHQLEIKFDGVAKTISWVIDGQQLFQMKSSEMLPAEHKVLKWGPNELFKFPNKINVGFGTLTAFEYYLSDENTEGIALVKLAAPMPFIDPRSDEPAQYVTDSAVKEYQAWGQGAGLYIEELVVERQ